MSRPQRGYGRSGRYSFGGQWGDQAAQREKEDAEKDALRARIATASVEPATNAHLPQRKQAGRQGPDTTDPNDRSHLTRDQQRRIDAA